MNLQQQVNLPQGVPFIQFRSEYGSAQNFNQQKSINGQSQGGSIKYHVKGISLLNFKEYIISKGSDETYDKLAQKVNLQNHLIITPGWYDVSIAVQLMEEAAKEFNVPLKKVILDSTRFVLAKDLKGIYGFFVKNVASITMVIGRLPKMTNTYLDFVETRVVLNEKGRIIANYLLPYHLKDWYLKVAEGAFTAILEVCGSSLKEFHTLKIETVLRGEDKLCELQLEARY